MQIFAFEFNNKHNLSKQNVIIDKLQRAILNHVTLGTTNSKASGVPSAIVVLGGDLQSESVVDFPAVDSRANSVVDDTETVDLATELK